ncbi:DUF1007 family protein [Rhodobacteraceae bacterium RKSG542]|nr:DUF1007 family protein [Pseudovibrio flavus]MTI16899.1 DUF1007 family protein [Pseudovibrio flavus]
MSAPLAMSHPHIFVEARAKLIFNDEGYLTEIEHSWLFDDLYAAFALQGLDANGDGEYSREELAELALENTKGLEEFGYFTFGDDTRVEMDFNPPHSQWMQVRSVKLDDYFMFSEEDRKAIEEVRAQGLEVPEDDRINLVELNFTLPLKEPVKADRTLTVDVYDPTYYVEYTWPKDGVGAVSYVNSPGACEVQLVYPPQLDFEIRQALAQIDENTRAVPEELQAYAEQMVNQAIVQCTDLMATAATDDTVPSEGAGERGSTNAVAAIERSFPRSGAAPDPRASSANDSVYSKVVGTIARYQNEFYLKLTGALRQFRVNPDAGWLLIALSFAYGIFHAAGPGHGKAIISSYVLADRQTLRKGIVLSMASAFAQGVTAIAIVGGVGILLGLTSIAMTKTTKWFELGSYVLVFLLGVLMVWNKIIRPVLSKNKAAAHSCSHHGHDHSHHHNHSHAHDHDRDHGHHHDHHHGECGCGHSHVASPEDIKDTPLTLMNAWSVIAAIGVRPCTGALVILAFAWSQNLLWIGVLAVLAMSIGTGITVSALASLAVVAREGALKIWGNTSSGTMTVYRVFEGAGALSVLLIGTLMMLGGFGLY